ncbi:MAG: chromosomal replication initiator protein [Solirubrobacteraceae bacterium]|nr:chromosomal replication initiator protein [Solirubrobacteraceae bacterium]
MSPDVLHIWPSIQGELRRAVPEHTYDLWLAPLRPLTFDGATVVVEAPDGMRPRIAARFGHVLQGCVTAVLGPDAKVEVVTAGDRSARVPRETPVQPDHDDDPGDGVNPRLTFESFVIGDTNRFAHAAALSVAELPGQAYNPLFIYGPPGVGKTHLLHAIGNYIRLYGAGLTVRYTTVEAFTNAFVWALQGGDIDRFKARFRRTDVLLIDDVQFLEAKVKTEEEFFHTFNALQDIGSQLVLTSDRLPRDLDALHDRLRERFEAGLVADIQTPDPATRMTVLRKRAQHDGVELSDEVLQTIAARIPTNIRALEGALIRVIAFSSLTGRPLSADLADHVLDGFHGRPRGVGEARFPGGPPAPTIEAIQEAVCEAFAISHEELLSPSRSARLVWPRQLAMYLAREQTQLTLPDIGRHFGGRNHTTVMHAVRRTADKVATDREAFETVRRLTAHLAGPARPDLDRRD